MGYRVWVSIEADEEDEHLVDLLVDKFHRDNDEEIIYDLIEGADDLNVEVTVLEQ